MKLHKMKLSPIIIMVLSFAAALAHAPLIDLCPKRTDFASYLVNLLVQQLEGKLMTDNSNGTTITFHFKYTKPH